MHHLQIHSEVNTTGARASINNKRRHNSMLVTGAKDRSKWLQEYSGFNIMELQDKMISNMSKTALKAATEVSE